MEYLFAILIVTALLVVLGAWIIFTAAIARVVRVLLPGSRRR